MSRPSGSRFPRVGALLVVLLVVAVLPGCSKKSSAPTSGGACDQQIAAANTALENALYAELNSNPQRPADVDFQGANQLYQSALLCSPTNATANFGAAVLGLLTVSSDAEVNAAFDEWKLYLQTHTPFEAPSARNAPLGVPVVFGSGRTALRLPFDLVPASVIALAQPRRSLDDPQISRLQGILESRVIPRLTLALARLQMVAADPGFRFVVTPRMQGDVDADPVEIDHTDVLALRAACGLLASACHVAVSYQLNFAAYDSLGLLQALAPGSGWMALRPQGAASMGSAGSELSGAVDDLDDAISSLLAESDPQGDDVIKIGPDGVSRAEAESIQVHLDDVRAGMTTGYTRVEDWDGNGGTPDVPLTIRLGQLFTNPVPDWKALFPSYTVSVVRKAASQTTEYLGGTVQADVTAPGDGSFSATYILNIQHDQVFSEYSFGDAFLIPYLQQVLQDRYAIAKAKPGYMGHFSGSAQVGATMVTGSNSVSISYQTFTNLVSQYTYSPVITWTADTFAQWIWPDPTLHGLLPGMGSSSQLLTTFGITADNWTKEVSLATSTGASQLRRRPLP
jgi:hypothetical protein